MLHPFFKMSVYQISYSYDHTELSLSLCTRSCNSPIVT